MEKIIRIILILFFILNFSFSLELEQIDFYIQKEDNLINLIPNFFIYKNINLNNDVNFECYQINFEIKPVIFDIILTEDIKSNIIISY